MKKTLILSLALALILGAVVPALADNDNGKGKGKGNDDAFRLAKEAKSIGSMLEVHITDTGKVLVRGAKVTAVSGNTISAETLWGSAVMTWSVLTDGSTEFIRRAGGKGSVSDIAVGDLISFQGTLQTSVASPLTVQAKIVKNWTPKPVPVPMTLEGEIKTPPVSSSTPTTMTATFKDRDYTVNIASDTSILNFFWLRIPLSSLAAGHTVRIYGLVNSSSSTIDATVIRDTSVR